VPATPRFFTDHHAAAGTRFLVFPQFRGLADFRDPVTVHLEAPPGSIEPGPSDEDLYVVDAIGKTPYYADGRESGEQPPYRGEAHPPARPGPGGHFDQIKPVKATARQFSATSVFATIRFVLMVWEHYLGRRVRWYFRERFPRLEVIPRLAWDNAYSRPGYIECGYADRKRQRLPFAENFDVVAHEVGHAILRDVVGHPAHPQAVEYRAREEAFADLVVMVALLHFEGVVDHLLRRTRGNLFSHNALSRIGEVGAKQTIRRAFSAADIVRLRWDDDPQVFKYRLAAPLTGACFDVLVELYERELVERDAIPRRLGDQSFNALGRRLADVQRAFAGHYARKAPLFADSLVAARDTFAFWLADAWRRLSPYDLYPQVARTLIEAGRRLDPALVPLVEEALEFRGIVPDPVTAAR
jgi:hypothetical protein